MPVIYIASYGTAEEVVYAFQVNLFGIILVSFKTYMCIYIYIFCFSHLTAEVGVPLVTVQFPSLKKLYHVQ